MAQGPATQIQSLSYQSPTRQPACVRWLLKLRRDHLESLPVRPWPSTQPQSRPPAPPPHTTSPSSAHSPKARLETPRHVIPQEVGAERGDQQIDRLHNLGGVSVFFDCAVRERESATELTNGGSEPQRRC